MKPSFLVIIRTYRRPKLVQRLLQDIYEQRDPAEREIRVWTFDDGTPPEASASHRERGAVMRPWTGESWFQLAHHGKKRAWMLYNYIFRTVKDDRTKRSKNGHDPEAQHYVFLDDDLRLCRSFFPRLLEVWETLPPNRTTLQLMLDGDRGPGPCWTNFPPRDAGPHARRTQWVDGAFLCKARFFERLDGHMQPIPLSRWERQPERSTGFGEQVSHRLNNCASGLYQVKRSLVVHANTKSLLNPRMREKHALQAVNFIDGEDRARLLSRALLEDDSSR